MASSFPYQSKICFQGTQAYHYCSFFESETSWLCFKPPSCVLPVFKKCSSSCFFLDTAPLPLSASQLALASSFLFLRQLAFFQSRYCILCFLVNLEPRGSQGQTRIRRSFCGILLLCFCWSSFFCWICFMAFSQAFSFFCFFLLWGCCSGTWLLSWGGFSSASFAFCLAIFQALIIFPFFSFPILIQNSCCICLKKPF